MDKVARIIDGPPPCELRDVHYWRQQTPQARLAALEEIRREYHRWKYGAEPRLQRVYRIIDLKPYSEPGPKD
jgi:hypothetical protein